MRSVLVTGAAGFLGRAVVNRLHLSGWEVHRIDNFDPRCGADPDYPAFNVDITQYEALHSVFSRLRPQAVVHLAAYGRNLTCQDHPKRAWEVNVNGTFNVLNLAKEMSCERALVCSSNITLCPDMTFYKATKLAAETLVPAFRRTGLWTVGIRPSNIYGPGQSKTEYQLCAFAGLKRSADKYGHVVISGDGTQTRDWVHVQDVARAIDMLMETTASKTVGNIYDICTGRQVSMNDVAKMANLEVKYGPARPGDAQVIISDPRPAFRDFCFAANYRLEDSIKELF